MKETYAKTFLYAYPHVEKLKIQIDELIEKKALASMTDFSPAIIQCEKIISLICQKDLLDEMKNVCDEIISKFSSEERNCLDYKYFKRKKREEYIDFDSTSRNYFRRQNKLSKKFALKLEKKGFTDTKFESQFLTINFFKELLKRVVEREDRVNYSRGQKKKPMLLKKIA